MSWKGIDSIGCDVMNPFGASATKATTIAPTTAWATTENPIRSQNAWAALGPVTG